MEPIRLIQKPVNGQIVFDVPDNMRDETRVIDFQPFREDERGIVMQARRGRLKKPTYPIEKYDVYNQ